MSALGLLEVVKVTGRACADRDYYVNLRVERIFFEKKKMQFYLELKLC